MKFSVIIPVYKVEKYLQECVDSVLNQNFKDFEVILVDDGSPDNCPGICDEYAEKDSRVKVIHQENAGLASARNSGLKIAHGEYICFIDSDDYLIDNNVLGKLSSATKTSPDIVHYKFSQWFESTGEIKECKFDYKLNTSSDKIEDIYCELIDKDAYYNSAWSKIIKRSLLIDNNILFEVGLLGEDNEWYYHVVTSANKVKLIDEPLYIYRRRKGSITTSTTSKNLTDQIYVIEKWINIIKSKQDNTRMKIVLGSLAKQYCSAVIIYSGLRDVEEFYPRLHELSYLLDYSQNQRVKYFRAIKKIIGLKGLIQTLKFIHKVR